MEKLQSILAAFKPRILFAYVFGSTGTALQNAQSDLDIAVYIDNKAAAPEIETKVSLYTEISRATIRNDIDIVILNSCTNLMLLYELMISGRVIYDSDPEARALFEQKTLHAAIDFKEQRERIFA